jgi:hypothetical protein
MVTFAMRSHQLHRPRFPHRPLRCRPIGQGHRQDERRPPLRRRHRTGSELNPRAPFYGDTTAFPKPPHLDRRFFLRLRNANHVVTTWYSADNKEWKRHWMQFEVSGYNQNVAGSFLSLAPPCLPPAKAPSASATSATACYNTSSSPCFNYTMRWQSCLGLIPKTAHRCT